MAFDPEPTPIPGTQGNYQPNQPWWNYSVPVSALGGGGWQGSNLMSPYDPNFAYGAYYDPFAGFTVGTVDMSSGFQPVTMPRDTSQSPADVVAGLMDYVPPFSEPGPLGDIPPVPEGFGDITQPPPIPDVPPDQPQVDANGNALPSSGPMNPYDPSFPYGTAPGYTPAGFPIGYTPFAGGGPGPAYSPGLGLQGLSSYYGGPLQPGGSLSIAGMPGTLVSTPAGEVYSTAVGMFGLGAMNAPGEGISMTGAGYGDQFSRGSSGWDQGFRDPGAISDFLAGKHGGLGPTDRTWATPKSNQGGVTSSHFGWAGGH